MPDTFHNLCVCISLGVAKGQGQPPEVVAQRCSRVAARKRDRDRVRKRDKRRRSSASMRLKTEAEAEAENFSVAPKIIS